MAIGAQKKWPEYEQQDHRVLTSHLKSQKQMSQRTLGLQISFKISNKDSATWPCKCPIFLDSTQGLLFNKNIEHFVNLFKS